MDDKDARIAALEEALQAGRDVMAVIHGDGGHYREAHGDRKAADDAISIIYKLRADLAAERECRKDAVRHAALCRALAGSWFYGNWMAETYNERMQEQMMRELGWWPITEDELVARGAAIDAAMSKD
jgi:hypothetical protein